MKNKANDHSKYALWIDPAEVTPYENNAKIHTEKQIENICTSIRRFGWQQDTVITKDNVLVIGHGRRLAALKLGCEMPYHVIDKTADELTEKDIRELRIADNQTNAETGLDFSVLEDELGDLDFDGFDFEFCIDDEKEEQVQVIEDEPPEVDEENEPTAKLGDVWQLGKHRLMCGDSTDLVDIDRLMDGVKADMVLSDPPYGMKLDTNFSTIKGSMKSLGRKNHTQGNKYEKVIGDNEDFKPQLITTFFANFDYVEEMFLFGADYFAELLPDKNKGSWLVWDKRKQSQADAIGSEFELIWSRNKHKRRMLRHDWFGFLSSENGADARNRVHPTQKPITLLVDILNQWGNDANVIVDLYGGSGSTLIACEQLGRKCRMMELDPRYCDVIIKRWETLTGEKAVLLNRAE